MDRLDFRINRLEKRVFGTQTPSSGTASASSVAGNDLITRIVELEAQLAAALPMLAVSDVPLDSSGANGQWAYDATHEHIYLKLGGTWREIQ